MPRIWLYVGVRGGVHVWSRYVPHPQYPDNMVSSIYRATREQSPPGEDEDGGYYDVAGMLKSMGIKDSA